MRYQAQFGRSFFRDLMNVVEGGFKKDDKGEIVVDVADVTKINIEMFYNVAWIFAKTADKDIPPPLEWLDTFDEFPLIEILPELQDMITRSLQSSKKK